MRKRRDVALGIIKWLLIQQVERGVPDTAHGIEIIGHTGK
jgi:hypothetical protein